jgi:group I intron endonuclease
MKFLVYKITNIKNNKFYIGQTNDMLARWISHLSFANSGGETYFANAIRKHGENSFVIEILERCETEKFVSDREIFWIAELKSKDKNIGYNMTDGGWNERSSGITGNSRKTIKISICKRQKGPINARAQATIGGSGKTTR